MKRIALLTAVLLVATVAAHTAAPPRGHEVRLLHDCNDDYFGGDALGTNDGHELHALDLYEAWDAGLGNIVVFRLTLAGEGPGEITLQLNVAAGAKTYAWTTQGSTWTGSFDRVEGPFQAKNADGQPDGDRFVLHGIVKQSKLGSNGAQLTDYEVQSRTGSDEADNMPGYDGGIAGSCSDDFERPDYTLVGPVQYADLVLEKTSIKLEVGQEAFMQVTASNKLRDQPQRITITPSIGDGVDVQMHNPSSNTYDAKLSVDLNKKGSAGDAKVAHVAITATQPGASGSIDVVLTTDLGGRVVKTFSYEVADAMQPDNPSDPLPPTDGPSQTEDSNDAPSGGALALLGALAVAIAARRR